MKLLLSLFSVFVLTAPFALAAKLPAKWAVSPTYKNTNKSAKVTYFARNFTVGNFSYPIAQASYQELENGVKEDVIKKVLKNFNRQQLTKSQKNGAVIFTGIDQKINRKVTISFKEKVSGNKKIISLFYATARIGYQDITNSEVNELQQILQKDKNTWEKIKEQITSFFSFTLLLEKANAQDTPGGWGGLFKRIGLVDLWDEVSGNKKSPTSTDQKPQTSSSVADKNAPAAPAASRPLPIPPLYDELLERYQTMDRDHKNEVEKIEKDIISFEKYADSVIGNIRKLEDANPDLFDHSTEFILAWYLDRNQQLTHDGISVCNPEKMNSLKELEDVYSYLESQNNMCNYYKNIFQKVVEYENKIFSMSNNLNVLFLSQIQQSKDYAEEKMKNDLKNFSESDRKLYLDELKKFDKEKDTWMSICSSEKDSKVYSQAAEILSTRSKTDLFWGITHLLSSPNDQHKDACEILHQELRKNINQVSLKAAFYAEPFYDLSREAKEFFNGIYQEASCFSYLKMGGSSKNTKYCPENDNSIALRLTALIEKNDTNTKAFRDPCNKKLKDFFEVIAKSSNN